MLRPVLPHTSGALLDSELVIGEVNEVYCTHCNILGIGLRQLVLCDNVHYLAGSSHYKLMQEISNNTQAVASKQCLVGLMCP